MNLKKLKKIAKKWSREAARGQVKQKVRLGEAWGDQESEEFVNMTS